MKLHREVDLQIERYGAGPGRLKGLVWEMEALGNISCLRHFSTEA